MANKKASNVIKGQSATLNAISNVISKGTIKPQSKPSTAQTAINSILRGIGNVNTTNARAAQTANAVSAQAQADAYQYSRSLQDAQAAYNQEYAQQQMDYNQQQAAISNALTAQWMQNQMAFNAEQADINRAFQTSEREAAQQYNASEAQKLRDWQEKMSSTAVQRQVADLQAAGINPILAANYMGANMGNGAAGTTQGMSGSTASVGSISANTASASLPSVSSGSISGYQGILENTSNTLALFGALAGGISTALQAAGLLDEKGMKVDDFLSKFNGEKMKNALIGKKKWWEK